VIHLQLLCWILGPAFTSSRDGFCPGLQIKTGIETGGQISKQSLSKLYSSQRLRFSRDLFLFLGGGTVIWNLQCAMRLSARNLGLGHCVGCPPNVLAWSPFEKAISHTSYVAQLL
jgi:hypothetical protein